jgi:hypothetical protein
MPARVIRPQGEFEALDRSVIPVGERRSAILDATLPAQPLSRGSDSDERYRWLEGELRSLRDLEAVKPTDRNGRLKSSLWGALQGFARGGLGGAVSGGIYGAARPEWDEKEKHEAELTRRRGVVDRALKIEGQLADIDRLRGNGGITPAQFVTQRRGFANYLAKFYPQGYTRGTRPDVDAELDRLQMEPPPALPRKGGQGRGYVFSPGQMIAFPDGSGGFTYQVPHDTEGNDAPAMSESQVQMNDAERRRIQLSLAEHNLRRAKEGLGPLTFDDYVTAGGGAAPPQPAPAPVTDAPPASGPLPRAGGPQLVPSGQKREPVQVHGAARGGRGGFRRGGSAGGASRSDSIGESLKARDAARYRVEATQADARAARARESGDDATAAAETEAARAAREEAQRLEGARASRPDLSSVGRGAAAKVSNGRVSRSRFVENNPQFKGKSQREIDATIRGAGYEPY